MLSPFARPVFVMAKPCGAACNLRCRYCYYLDKNKLYHGSGMRVMTDELLEEYIRQYLQAQTTDEVQFVWHGGEPTLVGLDFYKKVMALQRKYGRGFRIYNSLQTNGMLLDAEWCHFLVDNHWLVGLSVDGTARLHDRYRLTAGGSPTHTQVMRAIECLNRYGVEWNAMATVNAFNADYPEEFYLFFRSIGCRYLQFTPVVEPEGDCNVSARQWGDFLCRLFDLWWAHDVGQMYVQIFDATLANYVGEEPQVCSLSTRCGHAAVMEHNGDLYCCDHFVSPEYLLGYIRDSSIVELMMSPRQWRFASEKSAGLCRQCRECEFLRLCHGECPKNRITANAEGERINYLCRGYRQFFAHTEPQFRRMAATLKG